jgi:hypothetical protein
MASILYNVTVKIEHSIIEEWLDWMNKVHIPDVMATCCFKTFQLSRLIGYEDEDGITYAVQYEAPNMELLNIYQKEHASALQSAHQEKFQGKYVAFRSLLEVIQRG